MTQINKLANERQQLWFKAGKQYLTKEERSRIHEISNTLPQLWDQHRREVAATHNPRLEPRMPRRELVIEGYD